MSTLVYTVLAISGLYVFFDVSYFLRGAYMWLRWKGAITDESKGILEESVHHSKRLRKRVSLYHVCFYAICSVARKSPTESIYGHPT